ncbi:hypothetical protein GO755_00100 [Spirosoma sp. HMF4905]|uniref:Uncharacterized protein n=1 Tax=Spirosoma arboris TaxID=2682092 RepID=A0A7K1S3L2_9BACT|nr:hypothetical protein [Spirosoma arboris]MVM28412.1 hypothetical protein [Spirosoma arboris]
MDTHQSAQEDNFNNDHIVTDWLVAISDLYDYYEQLESWVNKAVIKQDKPQDSTHFMGQCPVHQLVSLVIRMEAELEILIQDMDQLAQVEPSPSKQHCQKLIAHTLRLTQLNQQAQTKLYLVSLPAS